MKLQLSSLVFLLAATASTALAKHTPVYWPREMCSVIGSRRCVRQGAFEHRRWVIYDCDYKGVDRIFEVCPGDCLQELYGRVKCVNPTTHTTTTYKYNGIVDEYGHH